MNLYLVRHGQDDESVRGGWCHNNLLAEGKRQSHQLGQELKRIQFDKIYSSDLSRAKETSKIIHAYLKQNNEINFSTELREINNGFLAGMKNDIAEEKYPGLYYRTLEFDENYPGGESPKEFYERIHNFLVEKIILSNDENILIITHGGVISIMYHILNEIHYTNKSSVFSIKTGTYIKISL